MFSRFVAKSLPRVMKSKKSLFHPTTLYSVSKKNQENLKKSEGLPVHLFFSDDSEEVPKNMAITSKTWKAPIQKYFWLPFLAWVPGGICSVCAIGGGYFVLKQIPNDRIQGFLKGVAERIPKYASSVTTDDPGADEKDFNMDFFMSKKELRFSKRDIENVELVCQKNAFGNKYKVVKISVKFNRVEKNDSDVMDVYVGCDNDFEADLVADLFETY